MTIGTAREYQNMSPEDQRKFDRWLQSNAIFGSIFAIDGFCGDRGPL